MLLLALAVAWLLSFTASPAQAQDSFYDTTGMRLSSYRPGALIRSRPMSGAPEGARAYRVL